MYKHNILFIGLDTHKISTEVAHIEDQRGAKPVHYGKVKTTKLLKDEELTPIYVPEPEDEAIRDLSRATAMKDLKSHFKFLLYCSLFRTNKITINFIFNWSFN